MAFATVTINQVSCCQCGVVFGLEAQHMADLRQDGRNFYCPNGHVLHYGDGEVERLKRKLAREQAAREAAEARTASAEYARSCAVKAHRAARTTLRKTRERIAAGVCPCCHRTFRQLARHITTKHPHYRSRA